LLESSIQGAKGVVFNITGGSDMTLHEVNTAAETIYEGVDPNANIIFGAVIDDEKMEGEIRITVIATGFSGEEDSNSSKSDKKESKAPAKNTTASSQKKSTSSETQDNRGLDIPDFLQRRRRR
jgi:cell division protein FtsZ